MSIFREIRIFTYYQQLFGCTANMKLITIVLAFLAADCLGQPTKWYFDSNMRYEYSINSTGNKNLFDTIEMKRRKFKTIYLVETSGEVDVDGNAAYQDTFIVYHFNQSGRPMDETHFEYDAFDNSNYKKPYIINFNEKPQRSDSTLTNTVLSKTGDSTIYHYAIWKFENGYDTARCFKTVYDKNKNVLEYEHTSTKIYFTVVDCAVGAFKRRKYRYDDKNRLIYVEWFSHKVGTYGLSTEWESAEYINISYPFYGKLIETYDSKTNTLKDSEVVLINDINGVITTTDKTMQVTTYPLEDGSKLIGNVMIVNMVNEQVQHFEFRYK